jgi:hypothetical protein
MYAVYQVCFDVPFAEEIVEWAQGLPWWAPTLLGLLVYFVGFPKAGRFVAGMASTPGGRAASALLWPATLFLFPLGKFAAAAGGKIAGPLVWLVNAVTAPKGTTVPLAGGTTRRAGGWVMVDGKEMWQPPTGGLAPPPPRGS